MSVYINGIGNVSPQKTWNNDTFLDELVEHDSNLLRCVDPNFKEYISPIKLRRMSHVIKIGLTSAFIALKDAKVENPDAIITGTGYGCVRDTEKFLCEMLDNDEQQLTPTAFMQSTHNTISGQIAISLKCQNYNATYVHRGVCFERALLDGMMLIEEGQGANILVGGFDEATDDHHVVMERLGYNKSETVKNLDLLKYRTPGTINGEAACSFVIAKSKTDNTYAAIEGLATFYKPINNQEVVDHIDRFLEDKNLSREDIDAVVLGNNGDVKEDQVYDMIIKQFNEAIHTYFKHLCGQFDASTSFGMWLAAKVLHTQSIPQITRLNEVQRSLNKVLLFNHHHEGNYSIVLLSKV